jgi:hypothetical protein
MPATGNENGAAIDRLTREVGIQAELLALNFALEGEGAEQASSALIALSRELRQAARTRPAPSEASRPVWRLEE